MEPYRNLSMKMINVNVSLTDLEELKRLVKNKMYPNRSEAIRMAVHDLVRTERNVKT